MLVFARYPETGSPISPQCPIYVTAVMKPVDNLKGFACQRPPFVIFVVCLLLFAIALISLGLYIQHHPVPNFEDKDWNDFLDDFSQQKFCIPLNDSANPHPTDSSGLNSLPTTLEAEGLEEVLWAQNVSFAVKLDFPAVELGKFQHLEGFSSLGSVVPAKQLDLDARYGNVDMVFQLSQPFDISSCKDEGCPARKVSACLSLALPPGAYPDMSNLQPKACNKSSVHTFRSPWVMFPKSDDAEVDYCSEGILVNTDYKYDPSLTLYLSQAEKSIVNLHLMYTSYFLFIMLITCVFYALVKGPPLKYRPLHEKNGSSRKQPV